MQTLEAKVFVVREPEEALKHVATTLPPEPKNWFPGGFSILVLEESCLE